MQKLFLKISYIFLIIFSSKIYASECSKEYYNFGKKIQVLVKNKDLKALFTLVDGELKSGPRKKDVENKKFDEVFDQNFVDSIEQEGCWQQNENNFSVGFGSIWFNDKFQIISINSNVNLPVNKELPIGWNVNGRMLGHKCFASPWMSSDNYKVFLETLNIKSNLLENFIENPSLYIKPGSKLLKPIIYYDEILNFAPFINACSINNDQFTIKNGEIIEKNLEFCDEEKDCNGYDSCYIYKIIGVVPVEKCQKLAPYFDAKCSESYLIKISSPSGGSMGKNYETNIYGLFELNDGANIIMPLKRFANENLALNFIEEKE